MCNPYRSISSSPTGNFTVTLSSIKGNVPKATAIVIPTSAKVHTAVQSILDDEPAWAKYQIPQFFRYLKQINNWLFTNSIVLTSILGCLVTEDLVWKCEGIRLDNVQLGIFSSSTVNVLTFPA